MKKVSILTFVFLLYVISAFSQTGNHPQAHFGKYGIQHYNTIAEYQSNYVGKKVMYLPARNQKQDKISTYDHAFQDNGGVIEKTYIITKIKGSDRRMKFTLQNTETDKAITMIINNQEERYNYGDYIFCITDNYSIPLCLIDELNKDKGEYIGQKYPKREDATKLFQVSDLVMKQESSYLYPVPQLELYDASIDDKLYCPLYRINEFEDMGKVFTSPIFKCTYEVIDVIRKNESNNTNGKENWSLYYKVKNDVTGEIKLVQADNAQKSCFDKDDKGSFSATLINVEKPANPEIRYGESTIVTQDSITKYHYSDNVIDILIFSSDKEFYFSLRNVSDNSIKVVWDEAVFADIDGSISKVIHSGTKYSEKDNNQQPSTIIKGAKLDDVVIPTNNLVYFESLHEWFKKSLYQQADKYGSNQTIRLMIPIQIKETINEYIFEFNIKYVFDHPELINNVLIE